MLDGGDGGAKVSEAAAGGAKAREAAPGGDDWVAIDQTLRGLARRRAALDVEEAAWLRRARAAGVHRHLGMATFVEYVERVLGYAPGAARERLRVAEALAVLPKLRAAMSAGDVAYSAARELTRVATVDTEAAWLAAAANHTVRDIEDMVRGRRPGDSPEDVPDPDARLHELRLLVTAATLGKFTATRRAEEAACGHPLTDDDVLAMLCEDRLAGSHVGDPAAQRPLHQIAITRCTDCLRAWHDVGGKTIEISATALAEASCDAELLGRVDGEKPARVTKTIPPRTRRAVLRRDRGRCVVPGCRNARYVAVHHVVPRVAGGDHAPLGLAALCSGHHKAVHDGRLRMEQVARGRWRFTRPDGAPYEAAPGSAAPSHVGPKETAKGAASDAAASGAPPGARKPRRASRAPRGSS